VRRQYAAADPDNRPVAGELEGRWNERLVAVALLEEEIQSARDEQPAAVDNECPVLLALAAALDVYVGEFERPPTVQLWSDRRVLITPHVSGGSDEDRQAV